jgi:hypothetical protein
MIEPEFPETTDDRLYRLHQDDATRRKAMEIRERAGVTGRISEAIVDRAYRVLQETPLPENVVLDIKAIQKDRAATMPGYRLVTFDEMEIAGQAVADQGHLCSR